MEGRTLHTRLVAIAAGAALAIATIACVWASFPPQTAHDPDTDYGYVYSGARSSSVDFANATMTDDSLLVFGSSELSTSKSMIPEVPAAVFGENDYGLQLIYVGEAYDQSLWHAVALGAYAQAGAIPAGPDGKRKVVIIVSPGWFEDGGLDTDTFETRFSYSLYEHFCDNPRISDDTKGYIRQRLLDCGISETKLNAAAGSLPQDFLNAAVFEAADDLRLRRELIGVRSSGIPAVENAEDGSDASVDTSAGGTGTSPDFDALRTQATADAEAATLTNDWGVEDSFYTEKIAPILSTSAGVRAGETYSDTSEYDDLSCFLAIARENDIETLVVISPVLGPYYDHIGISAATRASCYERIRTICQEYDAPMADFSDCEYEKYFLFDIVHFGWIGWVDVEQSIYSFWERGVIHEKRRRSIEHGFSSFLASHNTVACAFIGILVFVALVGLFLYIVFAGFGSSADFIYSRF